MNFSFYDYLTVGIQPDTFFDSDSVHGFNELQARRCLCIASMQIHGHFQETFFTGEVCTMIVSAFRTTFP